MPEKKLFKSLSDRVNDETFKNTFGKGTICFISWERFQPYIEHCVDRKVGEFVEGIKVDEKGIHVKVIKK